MMVPSGLQLPPRPEGTSHNVWTAPPPTGIFLSFPSAKNAIHSPSGEKNGCRAPEVPGRGVAFNCSRRRTYSCAGPAAGCATKVSTRPSADSAKVAP